MSEERHFIERFDFFGRSLMGFLEIAIIADDGSRLRRITRARVSRPRYECKTGSIVRGASCSTPRQPTGRPLTASLTERKRTTYINWR